MVASGFWGLGFRVMVASGIAGVHWKVVLFAFQDQPNKQLRRIFGGVSRQIQR